MKKQVTANPALMIAAEHEARVRALQECIRVLRERTELLEERLQKAQICPFCRLDR